MGAGCVGTRGPTFPWEPGATWWPRPGACGSRRCWPHGNRVAGGAGDARAATCPAPQLSFFPMPAIANKSNCTTRCLCTARAGPERRPESRALSAPLPQTKVKQKPRTDSLPRA